MSAPVVHSAVHDLWIFVRNYEGATNGVPLILNQQQAAYVETSLVAHDSLAPAEATIVVHALFYVIPPWTDHQFTGWTPPARPRAASCVAWEGRWRG